jgi:hypothetical protein
VVKAPRRVRSDWGGYLALNTIEEPQIDRLIVWPTDDGIEVYIEPDGGVELCVCIDWRQVGLLLAFVTSAEAVKDRRKQDGG